MPDAKEMTVVVCGLEERGTGARRDFNGGRLFAVSGYATPRRDLQRDLRAGPFALVRRPPLNKGPFRLSSGGEWPPEFACSQGTDQSASFQSRRPGQAGLIPTSKTPLTHVHE